VYNGVARISQRARGVLAGVGGQSPQSPVARGLWATLSAAGRKEILTHTSMATPQVLRVA